MARAGARDALEGVERTGAALAAADLVVAVNAEFDKGIWEFIAAPEYGAPTLPGDKWYCAAAQCRVNALPGSLEKAARALGRGFERFYGFLSGFLNSEHGRT